MAYNPNETNTANIMLVGYLTLNGCVIDRLQPDVNNPERKRFIVKGDDMANLLDEFRNGQPQVELRQFIDEVNKAKQMLYDDRPRTHY